MKAGFKMMISCDEATDICNKSQYNEATLWDIAKLKLHLLICRVCRQFSSKNTKLTKLCRDSELHALSQQEKEHMKAKLQEEDAS